MIETRKAIGRQLRTLREERGYSLAEFALMVGVERSYLGKIEAGYINTSVDKLEKIALGFGMTLFEFFQTFNDKNES